METSKMPAPRITHVFLDFAGTLVEGVPNWEWPQIRACAESGIAVTPAEVKAAIWDVWGPLEGCAHVDESADEASYRAWIDAIEGSILVRLGVGATDLPVAIRRVTDLQVEAACYRVYPDVKPALHELRRLGLRLGIVSNFAWDLPRLVEDLGLAPLVVDVVTSARLGFRKPGPEVFHLAAARLKADPVESCFVGDDPTCDVEGATKAGLRAVWLDRRRPSSSGGDRVASLTDLIALLGSTDN
jgi:putative hydrolase of the HAD superfamily